MTAGDKPIRIDPGLARAISKLAVDSARAARAALPKLTVDEVVRRFAVRMLNERGQRFTRITRTELFFQEGCVWEGSTEWEPSWHVLEVEYRDGDNNFQRRHYSFDFDAVLAAVVAIAQEAS